MKCIIPFIIFLAFSVPQASFPGDGFVILMCNGSSFNVDNYYADGEYITYYRFGAKIKTLKKNIEKITAISSDSSVITVIPDESLFKKEADLPEKKYSEKQSVTTGHNKNKSISDCKKKLRSYKSQLNRYTYDLAEAKRNRISKPRLPSRSAPGITIVSPKAASRHKKFAQQSYSVDKLEELVRYYEDMVKSYQEKCGK